MRPLPLFLLASLAGALAFTSEPSAQLPVWPEPNARGQVTVLGACPMGSGSLPNSSCTYVRVASPGNKPANCQLRIAEPDPGTTRRGTVLLGSGGAGADFYEEVIGGYELIRALQSRGFRVVDRRWDDGWFGRNEPMIEQSHRYATLLSWVRKNHYDGGVMCAVGNSGGAGEIGYALTTWGRSNLLDVAVLCGGPPFSRIDYMCGFPTEPAWQSQCLKLVPAGVMECGIPMCAAAVGSASCQRTVSVGTTAAAMYADSILHPSPLVHFPSTRVHFLIGAQDCTVAGPQALLLYDAITSEKVLEFVPRTPHWVPQTPEGRDAIERALLGGTTCRAGAATLNVSAYPQVGGTLDLTVTGPPGEVYLVLVGFGTMVTEVPTFGWFFLMPPVFPIDIGLLHPVSGRANVSVPIPPYQFLSGLTLYDQAFTGPCLTNLVRAVIL